jgi:hypothetical protein
MLRGGVAVLAALGIILSAVTPLSSADIPVVALKPFISTPMWQLDITWHAEDAYEDQDMSAALDMTATARFILKQADRRDDWGRWHVEKADSHNMALTGHLINKNDKSRTQYTYAPGPVLAAGVNFEVGGRTPGYQLVCSVGFPIKINNPLIGAMDSMATLQTTDIHEGTPIFCSGPLPTSGEIISGSLVIPSAVGPFVGSTPPFTRVGIQFVLKPYNDLAPLTPIK